jgi:predicted secreted Zn-dependent protease
MDLDRAAWQKSSYSHTNGCVEVTAVEGRVAIRNSEDPHGKVLIFTKTQWQAFLDGVRNGEFNPI